MKEQFQMRKFLYTLFQKIRELGLVATVTAEIPEGSKALSRFGVVEFMADSIIKLQYLEFADVKRSLSIRKMRMTNHSSNTHPFEITNRGIEILPI
jgi:circadian clock protein KaiC